MNVLILILCAAFLSGCGRPSQNLPGGSDPVHPAHRVLSEPDRKKIIDSATAGLSLERDKMERVSFYSPADELSLSSRLSAYLSVPDNSPPLVRIHPVYFGSRWVFFESIKIMADDEIVYEKTFDISDLKRDNEGGSVWETADYAAKYLDLQSLRKIAAAKKATIRFSGSERREDHDFSELEFKNLRRVLSAYDALGDLRT